MIARFSILSALVLGAPAAAFLAIDPQTAEEAGPAMLVFILMPAVAAAAMGWRVKAPLPVGGLGRGATMLLSAAAMGLVLLVNLPAAFATGVLARGPGVDVGAGLAAAATGLVTSTLEELGWAAGATRVSRRAFGVDRGIVALGVVWAAWHLVVGVLGPPEVVRAMFGTTVPLSGGRVVFFVLGCVAFRFVLTALRDRADSVWPAVVAHATGNMVLGFALGAGLWRLDGSGSWWFFPGPTGLGFLVACVVAALWLRRGLVGPTVG